MVALTLRDTTTKNDTTYRISQTDHGTHNQPTILKAELASDFITYRFSSASLIFGTPRPIDVVAEGCGVVDEVDDNPVGLRNAEDFHPLGIHAGNLCDDAHTVGPSAAGVPGVAGWRPGPLTVVLGAQSAGGWKCT